MKVIQDGRALRVEWRMLPDRRAWQEAGEGAYLLRAKLENDSAPALWAKYIQWTEVEAAFRALKSERLVRPFFHQWERRVKAHILVAFLGYALGVTRKHLLRRKDSKRTPAQALALWGSIQSADMVLPTTDGREIRLRRVTPPSAEQKALLASLGLTLPERLDFDLECSVNSATR